MPVATVQPNTPASSLGRGIVGAGIAASVVAGAVAVARPTLAPMAAGVVLLVVGFAVMAPCSVQMALTMARVVERTRESRGTSMRMAAYGLAVQRVSEATTTRGLYP